MEEKKKEKKKRKFVINNPFFDFMGEIGDWVGLNILFLITSVPLVTVGASLTALYKVMMKKSRDEAPYPAALYLRTFRQEWRQSTALWLILLVSGMILGFDFLYVSGAWRHWSAGILRYWNVGLGCLLLVWLMVFSYVFPLQAYFENSVKNTLKNAFLMSVRHAPFTLVLAAANSLPLLCLAFSPVLTWLLTPVYLVIGFSMTAGLGVRVFERIFAEYIEEYVS